jgi:hypothetical protein
VWMHENPLAAGRTYIAKHTTRTVRATVRAIDYGVDVNTLDRRASETLAMNEIAEVEFETNLPLFFDSYRACRWTGSLILIDPLTNATVGAAMIVAVADGSAETAPANLRGPSLILLPGNYELAARVRDALLARGERAVLIDDPLIPDSAVPSVVRALDLAGVIAISSRTRSQVAISEIEGFTAGVVLLDDGLDEEAILKALTVKL